MGWSYTHIVLFGPDQQQVAANLAERQAAISPTVHGFTLVADALFESPDEGRITAFAADLSVRLGCAAIVVSEYDDDVLRYQLIEAGQVTDTYDSEPDYFDFAGKHVPPRGPQGGDARRLCATLKCPGARAQVDIILHQQDPRLPAPERHRKLAMALGMATFSIGFSYGALQEGELPEGLDDFDVVFTEKEPG